MIFTGILDAFHAVLHVSAAFFWTRALATFLGASRSHLSGYRPSRSKGRLIG
jgi:hypothetical protein